MQSHFGAELLRKCHFDWCNHGPGTMIFSLQITFSCFATLLTDSFGASATLVILDELCWDRCGIFIG